MQVKVSEFKRWEQKSVRETHRAVRVGENLHYCREGEKMKITVNGLEALITREPTRSPRLLGAKGEQCYGTQSTTHATICIDESLDYPLMRKVVRHEIAHFFLYAHLLEVKDTYSEEELCEFVALYSSEINRIANEFMGERK